MLYSKMKELEAAGFSQRVIAKRLKVSRNTVKKYLSQDVETFTTWLSSTQERGHKLDVHQNRILDWLRKYPDLSSSQIHDWLEERGFLGIAESTLRRYVKELREEFQIPKKTHQREYEAIQDPPMGEQAQIDFGQIMVPTETGKQVKLYVISFVLSHSRYKYMEWWDHPYSCADVIEAHEHAFDFFGGKPRTIVYDQDRAMFVNENYGEIIFTAKFETYRQTQKFQVHACRSRDPESKGRIENVIGFIKHNFAKNRRYTTLDNWNEQALSWLRRKGNGKVHNTTKKIPSEVFKEERRYLIPVRSMTTTSGKLSTSDPAIRAVHKDNTVKYQTNRYSVPLGTYTRLKKVVVSVSKIEDTLKICDPETGELLATHQLCHERGHLIKKRRHGRDMSASVAQLIQRVGSQFNDQQKAQTYLNKIHQKFPRYARDQVGLIESLFNEYPTEMLDDALEQCIKSSIISATGLRDIVKRRTRQLEIKTAVKKIETHSLPAVSDETKQKLLGIKPEIRGLENYTHLLGGGK